MSFFINDYRNYPPIILENESLFKFGYDLTLITPEMKLPNTDIENNPQIHKLKLLISDSKGNSLLGFIKLISFIAQSILYSLTKKGDAFIGHDLTGLLPAFFLGKLKKKPIIYHAHELYTERSKVRLRWIWEVIEKKLIKHIDLLIVPEENRSKYFVGKGYTRKSPLVIPNYSNLQIINPNNLLNDYLIKKGSKSRNIICVYAGYIRHDACITELVKAFSHLDNSIKLFLIGNGEKRYISELKEIIKSMSLKRQIFFWGSVPYSSLFELLPKADMGIALYRNTCLNNYYCSPSKLGLYFQCGLPVITSNFPSMMNLVTKNELGLVVDPENPKSIADAIGRIAKDDDLRKRFSYKSRHYAETVANWEIYENLLVNEIGSLIFVDI